MKISWPGLTVAVLVLIIVLGMHALGWFTQPRGWFYDRIVSTAPAQDEAKTGVLTLALPHDRWRYAERYWQDMLDYLLSYDPTAIVVLGLPERPQAQFFRRYAENAQVHWVRTLSYSGTSSLPTPDPLPHGAAAIDTQLLWYRPPPFQRGVYRYAYPQWTIGGESVRDYSVVLAERMAWPSVKRLNRDPYLINFTAGENHIPRVLAPRIEARDLLHSMVAERVVIIGAQGDQQGTLATPFSTDRGIDLLELQGYVVNTLINNNMVAEPPLWQWYSVLVCVIVISLIVYLKVSLELGGVLTLCSILSYAMLSWTSLVLWNVFLPFIEFVVAQLMLFSMIFRERQRHEQIVVGRLIRQASTKLHKRIMPSNFYQSEDPWTEVINMINQTLNLKRSIFLERIEHDHKVKEIKALNCTLDDIQERRRDFERTPYHTAIEEAECIELKKPFLRPTMTENQNKDDGAIEREKQFMVPLVFGGKVLGFWSFSVDPKKTATDNDFFSTVNAYGEQIAELLYHRKQLAQAKTKKRAYLQHLVQINSHRNFASINATFKLLERRLSTFEDMFAQQQTAIALYDLFGKVIQANECMQSLANRVNLPIYQSTAIDLIVQLSGCTQMVARNYLQQVVMDRSHVQLTLTLEVVRKSYLLHIRPLAHGSPDVFEEEEVRPFELSGLLLELIDISYPKQGDQCKAKLSQKISHKIRQDLVGLLGIMKRLETAQTSAPQENQNSLSQSLSSKLGNERKRRTSRICDALNSLESLSRMSLGEQASESMPVDPLETVAEVLVSLDELRVEKQLAWQTEFEQHADLIMVDMDHLRRGLSACLEWLIDDSATQKDIVVMLKTTGSNDNPMVMIGGYNHGFGLPQQKLVVQQKSLFTNKTLDIVHIFGKIARCLRSRMKTEIRSN